MAVIADCPGCVVGDHQQHVTQWGFRAEGIIDGEFCHCSGDCKTRSAENMARWFPPVPAVPDPATEPEPVQDRADERDAFVEAHGYELTDVLLNIGIEDADAFDGRALADFLFCAGWRKTAPATDAAIINAYDPKDTP